MRLSGSRCDIPILFIISGRTLCKAFHLFFFVKTVRRDLRKTPQLFLTGRMIDIKCFKQTFRMLLYNTKKSTVMNEY